MATLFPVVWRSCEDELYGLEQPELSGERVNVSESLSFVFSPVGIDFGSAGYERSNGLINDRQPDGIRVAQMRLRNGAAEALFEES